MRASFVGHLKDIGAVEVEKVKRPGMRRVVAVKVHGRPVGIAGEAMERREDPLWVYRLWGYRVWGGRLWRGGDIDPSITGCVFGLLRFLEKREKEKSGN